MFKIDLKSQIRRLRIEREKVLKSYLKNGRTEEEFNENYKDRFQPTLSYDKDGKLVSEGYFDGNTIVRIR
jgi:hypothetical protein